MAIAHIGGVAYQLETLVYRKMRRVWPLLQKHRDKLVKQSTGDQPVDVMEDELESAEDAIKIVAICLEKTHPDMTADKIMDTMTAGEVPLLKQTIQEILLDSGLVKLGNLESELEEIANQLREKLSMEISTSSSGSLSPRDVKAEGGT